MAVSELSTFGCFYFFYFFTFLLFHGFLSILVNLFLQIVINMEKDVGRPRWEDKSQRHLSLFSPKEENSSGSFTFCLWLYASSL